MIQGKRVLLRALEHRDVEQLRMWRNHPELFGYHCSSMLVSEMAQERWAESYGRDTSNILFIIENEENQSIGYTLIKDLDHKNRRAEIGLHLDPTAQGRGYGQEALQTLMRYCFQELNLHRLYLQVFDFNTRALALYEKMGFKTEGRLRDAFYTQNAYHDIVVMSILENELQAE